MSELNEQKNAALGKPVPQLGMNRTLTTFTLLPTLALVALIACRSPTNFKCDPISGSGADCDAGAGATGGGRRWRGRRNLHPRCFRQEDPQPAEHQRQSQRIRLGPVGEHLSPHRRDQQQQLDLRRPLG